MVKFNKINIACFSAILFNTVTLPVWAYKSKDIEIGEQPLFSFSAAQMAKVVIKGGYDALFKQQVESAKDKVVYKVGVKLKQVLWKAGDLAVLDNDGKFTPVVHQYKNLADWSLHFVLSDTQRNITVKALQATSWYHNFECQIEASFRKTFGVGNLEDFIKLMADKSVDSMIGTGASTILQPPVTEAPSPSSPVRNRLTRKEITDLEQQLAFESGRSDALKLSQENWGVKDWTGYIMYQLSKKVNMTTDRVIDWVEQQFVQQLSQKENALARETVAIVGGTLGALVHPVVGITAAGVTRYQITGLPTNVLELQRQMIHSLLEKAKSKTSPLILITDESIRKFHTEVFTVRDITFNVEGVDHEFTLIDKDEVRPSLRSAIARLTRPLTKVTTPIVVAAGQVTTAYKEGAEKGKKTKTFAGQKITYTSRSAPLQGAVNVIKTGTVGAVKVVGKGFGRLWGAFSFAVKAIDG